MKRKLVNFVKVASFIGAMCIGICAIEGMCIPLMSVWIYVFIFLYAQKEKPCDGSHKTSKKLSSTSFSRTSISSSSGKHKR